MGALHCMLSNACVSGSDCCRAMCDSTASPCSVAAAGNTMLDGFTNRRVCSTGNGRVAGFKPRSVGRCTICLPDDCLKRCRVSDHRIGLFTGIADSLFGTDNRMGGHVLVNTSFQDSNGINGKGACSPDAPPCHDRCNRGSSFHPHGCGSVPFVGRFNTCIRSGFG